MLDTLAKRYGKLPHEIANLPEADYELCLYSMLAAVTNTPEPTDG